MPLHRYGFDACRFATGATPGRGTIEVAGQRRRGRLTAIGGTTGADGVERAGPPGPRVRRLP
jgi:hypothetical protein